MIVKINPSKAYGKVVAPPSKSMAHRLLICGALSEKSVINNIAFSKDIEATLGCLKSLGAKVLIDGKTVNIGGLKLENIPDGVTVDCFESGSTLRFLLPLCMACGKTVTLKGANRLFERPLDIYEDIAKKQAILFEKGQNYVTVCGNLKSENYEVAGNISSQFISGLLFLLPLLSGDSVLNVTGKFESASYIDLTLSALNDFGIKIDRKDNVFYIKGKQNYADCDCSVEGDCSNAAFLDAFNYLGSRVTVCGIKENTLQGDRVYADIFLGLKDGRKHFDLSDCPDLAPVVFAVSSLYGGAEFTGTKRLKIKESDRAKAMKEELSKFGADVQIFEDLVVVKSDGIKQPKEVLNSHNDHRIAMALSLLLTITGGSISGAESVTKSYPDFYKQISKIGIDLYEIN